MVVATFLLMSKNIDNFNEIQSFDEFVEWQAIWLPRSHITIHSAGDFLLLGPFFSEHAHELFLSRFTKSIPRVMSISGSYAFHYRRL
jgi:hypothetical protein